MPPDHAPDGHVTRAPRRMGLRLPRLTTGQRLLLILTIALAPLGAIAVGTSTRSIAASDSERELLMSVSVRTQAGRLHSQLRLDAALLHDAVHAGDDGAPGRTARLALSPVVPPALEEPAQGTGGSPADPPTDAEALAAGDAAGSGAPGATAEPAPVDLRANPDIVSACALIRRVFPGGEGRASARIVDTRTGANRCDPGSPADPSAADQPIGMARIDRDNGELVFSATPVGANSRADIVYPAERIEQIIVDDGLPRHRLTLASATGDMTVHNDLTGAAPALSLEARAPVGNSGLVLTIVTGRSWLGGPELISMLMPLGMWLLAALLSWLLVDQILLAPIQRLRRSVERYQPGDRLAAGEDRIFTAPEIIELERMVAQLAANVASDKEALAASLEAQRALTREVHHRVKNNLQIIASLINLHGRSLPQGGELIAYRGIQRRVDTLAVVHRHLQAEAEEDAVIALGTMLGELTVGLRHAFETGSRPAALTIDAAAVNVDQDVALPVAFIVTELVELAHEAQPGAAIAIKLERSADARVTLSVASAGFTRAGSEGERFGNYARILTGLARQLRQPLEFDAAAGRYTITIPLEGGSEDQRPAA
jgi:two-component system, sensor histidine kinase PdtaS